MAPLALLTLLACLAAPVRADYGKPEPVRSKTGVSYAAPRTESKESGGGGAQKDTSAQGIGGRNIQAVQPAPPSMPEGGGAFRSNRAEAEAAAAGAASPKNAPPGGSGFVAPTSAGSEGRPEPGSPEDVPADKKASGAKPPPMTLADAKLNFETLVITHIASEGTDNVLQFDDPKKARTRRLTLATVKTNTLRETGESLFAGMVAMKDATTKEVVDLEFTADFSGNRWIIVKVALPEDDGAPAVKVKKAAAPSKAKARAPAKSKKAAAGKSAPKKTRPKP